MALYYAILRALGRCRCGRLAVATWDLGVPICIGCVKLRMQG